MSLLSCSKIALTVGLLMVVRCQTCESATVTDLLSAMLNTLRNIESLMTYNTEAGSKGNLKSLNSNVNKNTNIVDGSRRSIKLKSQNLNDNNNQNSIVVTGAEKAAPPAKKRNPGGQKSPGSDEEKVVIAVEEERKGRLGEEEKKTKAALSEDDKKTKAPPAGGEEDQGENENAKDDKARLFDVDAAEENGGLPASGRSRPPGATFKANKFGKRIVLGGNGNANLNSNLNTNKNVNVLRNNIESKRVEGARRANMNYNKNVNVQLAQEASDEDEEEPELPKTILIRRSSNPAKSSNEAVASESTSDAEAAEEESQ